MSFYISIEEDERTFYQWTGKQHGYVAGVLGPLLDIRRNRCWLALCCLTQMCPCVLVPMCLEGQLHWSLLEGQSSCQVRGGDQYF